MNKANLKKLPPSLTDEEAEDFVANCDLTEYDLSGFRPYHFELKEKDTAPANSADAAKTDK